MKLFVIGGQHGHCDDTSALFLPSLRRQTKQQKNPVALVLEQTILIERPPLVGEVRAKFLGIEVVPLSVQRIPKAVFSVYTTGAATISSK
jgi:hypothetical protein